MIWRALKLKQSTGTLALVLTSSLATVAGADFSCLIEPYKVVNASTAVEGILSTVNFEKGSLVQEGEVLAELESEVEKVAVEQMQARVNMVSVIEARKVSLERSKRKYDRALKLSGQKFVSPDDIDELESDVELAKLKLKEERENRSLAELELRRVTAQYELRIIKSPITGVIVERYLSAGEFAQAQPIVRIAQLDPLNVEVVLPSDLYGKVKEGSPAEVSLPEPIETVLVAKVKIVERVIDAASGTFGLRLELPNPDYQIPAGLECRVKFLN